MDRILKITLGLFLVTLALTVGYAAYDSYVGGTYRATLSSTAGYTLSVTTDKPLSNVTLFIPVPADASGNSLAVSLMSARAMPGLPQTWQTTLFDTGKGTLLKIHIPQLDVPAGTSASAPYTISMSAQLPEKNVINTLDPVENSPIFAPMQDFRQEKCTDYDSAGGSTPVCAAFTTALYADYSADPGTAVTITSSFTGRNSWNVFEPESNEYTTTISLPMQGENHGWVTTKGTLAYHIGSFNAPFTIQGRVS